MKVTELLRIHRRRIKMRNRNDKIKGIENEE